MFVDAAIAELRLMCLKIAGKPCLGLKDQTKSTLLDDTVHTIHRFDE